MRARYYDPSTSRFISEDPTGFGGGDVNLYAYVGGNPISNIDPSGTCVPCAFIAGRLLIQGARIAAPVVARGAVAGFNAARTYFATRPATTAILANPATLENAIDFVVGFSTSGPPPPSLFGALGSGASIAIDKGRDFLNELNAPAPTFQPVTGLIDRSNRGNRGNGGCTVKCF